MGGDAFLGARAEAVAELECTKAYLGEGLDWAAFRERTYRRGELAMLLRQEDRLGMWHGLECRVPFVDEPLVRLASRFAPELLIKDGYLKYPLRMLYEEMPHEVRFDASKAGFWDMSRERLRGVGKMAAPLTLSSELLRRVFPDIESGIRGLRRDDRLRLLQIAVLERASDRAQARELAEDMEGTVVEA